MGAEVETGGISVGGAEAVGGRSDVAQAESAIPMAPTNVATLAKVIPLLTFPASAGVYPSLPDLAAGSRNFPRRVEIVAPITVWFWWAVVKRVPHLLK